MIKLHRCASSFLLLVFSHITILNAQAQTVQEKGLKDYYKAYFPVGVAVSPASFAGDEGKLIQREFNSMTPENSMKMGPIHPKENEYFWKDADSIVNFAVKHGFKIRGHNLCWHEQTPDWIFKDKDGKDVSKEVLLQRLKSHITTVVNRYKGKIYAWDVVNEAVDDDSTKFLRNSKWYQICGEDFIIKAFEYAHAADPQALLFYNDYNTEFPEKRERVYKLLKLLKDKNVPIYGVGLQGHWSIFDPTEKDLRAAIERYSSLGLKIHFTEIDMSVYAWEKYPRKLKEGEKMDYSPEIQKKQTEQYAMVFRVFRAYKDVITSVTFWNISDKTTWLDHYPVEGRKNYPLLFDTKLQKKSAYQEVVNFK